MTAEQAAAFLGEVEHWSSLARRAAGDAIYDITAEAALPVPLPGWVKVEPCPPAHLDAMLAAAHQYPQLADQETPAGVCSTTVRDGESGILLGLRRLRVLPRRSRPTGPERTWTVRALLAWAVLAGLFFMHGAPWPAGCQDGAPTMPVTAVVTANLPAAAATGTVRLTADWTPAMSAAAGARPPAAPPPPASRAAAEERGPCCAGLCSSRQPRQGPACPLAAGPAGAVLPSNLAALPARCPSAAARSARPPGRPGLPLPLFLGVSRT